jgi:precorrin-6A/cobalt-precorrin-6A reductase
MILLLGGTAETAVLAARLAGAGYGVLVSTATGIALETGRHPRIERRTGRLDECGLAGLAGSRGIRAIVDAAHPYAEAAHASARKAALAARIPCYAYIRPPAVRRDGTMSFARTHEEAAVLAFAPGRPVLLTTGSRNLIPYAAAARRSGTPLVVRVLDTPESLQACIQAGIPAGSIVTGRGPFSLEENRRIIRDFGIGVIVTKDGGIPGGVHAKIEAAHREGCILVVLSRPPVPGGNAFDSIDALLQELSTKIPPRLSPIVSSP